MVVPAVPPPGLMVGLSRQEYRRVAGPMGQQSSWSTPLDDLNFEAWATADAAGWATPDEVAALQAAPDAWVAALRRLIMETDEALTGAGRITGDERDQVLADLRGERRRLGAALARLTGEGDEEDDEDADEPAVAILQASWENGRVVLWAGGRRVAPGSAGDVQQLIDSAGASSINWEPHPGVTLPDGGPVAPAVSAPVGDAIGWLVGVGAGQLAADAGPSLHWVGEVAAWATDFVAQGRMVPVIRKGRRKAPGAPADTSRYAIRWIPALVDARRLGEVSRRMPGAVGVLDQATQPEAACRSLLAAAVDAVCRVGATRLVAPATVPVARSRADVAEAVLGGFDGSPFVASARVADDMAGELKRWAEPVTAATSIGLTVTLDPPEKDGGWLVSVNVTGIERRPLPVEHALAAATRARADAVEAQLRRLEVLLPVLRRPSSRRGQVVIGGDEAWTLMAETGPVLVANGFDVRIPSISKRRPTPRLQLRADAGGADRPKVGAQQLSNVQWSVLFDDVELDASAIARLAAQAKPMVLARGRWVELDRNDLAAAASALVEKSKTTQLSGAAILRHAVGLEGDGLGGPVSVEGSGWAVDLVRGATTNPPTPQPAPDGFEGELREYQAEARGWLNFLDTGGLGGCLAMDMGLGKTPTILAHLLNTRGDGPSLVIAPPAVLGNWAAEAARFTPDLRVRVHHGPERAGAETFGAAIEGADVVLTTYATAARDAEMLADVDWHRLVVDEAQVIKNPASETAQALRGISARSRLALTGTPIENGLGDLWAILDFTNPGLVGPRTAFISQLSRSDDNGRGGEAALRALNGLLVFRRTKLEPAIAAELPDKIDEIDHCGMTQEQIGLYQAVLDRLLAGGLDEDTTKRKGQVLAAITALKQICDHPAAYVHDDDQALPGRSGKLARLDEIVDAVFEAGERILVFTHFARWGEKLAAHLSARMGVGIDCYHGGLSRTVRDRLVKDFQEGKGPGALVLSLKAGGSGLNLTAANHVVLYDRWWNPAVEDQARDRAWRIGQQNTVICHRLVCPGTIDERVEEVVAGKRRVADLVLPASSSLGDLSVDELRLALGLRTDALLEEEPDGASGQQETAA